MRHVDPNIIELFDLHLTESNVSYSASIIGGAAIMLVSNSLRPTGDIDSVILIPAHIKEEVAKFARNQRISETWFNDNASRNNRDFVKDNENVFVHRSDRRADQRSIGKPRRRSSVIYFLQKNITIRAKSGGAKPP